MFRLAAFLAVGILGFASADDALVPNGGFERDANNDGIPDGWTFAWKYTHSTDPDLKEPKQEPDWGVDTAVCHSGSKSVRVGVRRKNDDGVWSTELPVPKGAKKNLLVRARIKTQGMSKSDARVALVSLGGKGKWLGADYGLCVANKDHDWRLYTGIYSLHKATERLRLRLWVNFRYTGTGTAWFDDMTIMPTDLEATGIKYRDRRPEPPYSAADRQTGFVVYRRDYVRLTMPQMAPTQKELERPFAIFATPGELEPLSICVRALRPVRGVSVEVTDLHGPKTASIPASAVDVRPVRILTKCGQSRWGPFADGDMDVPAYLEDRKQIDVPANTTRQFWATVNVPASAAAGEYHGKIIVTDGFGARIERPVTLRVFPFTLDDPPGMYFGMYSRYKKTPGLLERMYADQRAYGMTTVGICSVLGARYERDGERVRVTFADETPFVRCMTAYKAAGFPRPALWLMGRDVNRWCRKQGAMDSEIFASCYRQIILAVLEEGKRRGWPEIIFQPVDEPFEHTTRLPITKRNLQILKTIPGLRTEEDGPNGNPGTLEELYPWCDVLVYHDGPLVKRGRYDREAWQALLERAKRDGKEIWFYNIDLTGYHPEVMRFGYGFGLSQMGGTGMIEWSYQTAVREGKEELVYKQPNAIIYYYPKTATETGGPAIGWEAIREGVDDYKYLAKLRALVDRARASGNRRLVRSADEAWKGVSDRLTRIDFTNVVGSAAQGGWTGPNEVDENGQRTVSGEYKLDNAWSFEDYDRLRLEIAEWIVRLAGEMGG